MQACRFSKERQCAVVKDTEPALDTNLHCSALIEATEPFAEQGDKWQLKGMRSMLSMSSDLSERWA